jgi:head-tail adaptor
MGVIGKMKRKVEIVAPVTTKSAMGAPQKSFAHLCYLLTSRVEDGEEPEGYVNNRMVRAPRFKYRAHVTQRINETMRLVDSGIVYNILSVDKDPESELFIEIRVEKFVE